MKTTKIDREAERKAREAITVSLEHVAYLAGNPLAGEKMDILKHAVTRIAAERAGDEQVNGSGFKCYSVKENRPTEVREPTAAELLKAGKLSNVSGRLAEEPTVARAISDAFDMLAIAQEKAPKILVSAIEEENCAALVDTKFLDRLNTTIRKGQWPEYVTQAYVIALAKLDPKGEEFKALAGDAGMARYAFGERCE